MLWPPEVACSRASGWFEVLALLQVTPPGRTRLLASLARSLTLAIAFGTATMAGANADDPANVEIRYQVSYGALPVGHMDARFMLAGNGYEVDATFGSGGLVRLIRTTTGRVRSSGTLDGTTVPEAFDLAYSYGDRSRERTIEFEGGTVGTVTIEPKPRADSERTPPTEAQLKGAVDPASGLVVLAPADGEPCGRTVKVFDGRVLLELTLGASRSKPFRAGDWRGEVRICDLKARPIAGTRRSSREEIEAVRGATIALAPVPGRDAWIAVELRVPASVGMVSARAVELSFGG